MCRSWSSAKNKVFERIAESEKGGGGVMMTKLVLCKRLVLFDFMVGVE